MRPATHRVTRTPGLRHAEQDLGAVPREDGRPRSLPLTRPIDAQEGGVAAADSDDEGLVIDLDPVVLVGDAAGERRHLDGSRPVPRRDPRDDLVKGHPDRQASGLTRSGGRGPSRTATQFSAAVMAMR